MASQPIYYCVLVWDESACTNNIVDAFTDPHIAFAVADLIADNDHRIEPYWGASMIPDGFVVDRRLTIEEYEHATEEWGIEVPSAMKPSVLEDTYRIGDIFEVDDVQYMLIATLVSETGSSVNLVAVKGRWIGHCVRQTGFNITTNWDRVPAISVRELLKLVFNEVEMKRVKRIPRPE